MSDFWRDPQLNELVREINRSDSPAETGNSRRVLPRPTLPAEPSEALKTLLGEVIDKEASDLLLISGSPPVLRIHGELLPLGSEPIGGGVVGQLFTSHLSPARIDQIELRGSADFSVRMKRGTETHRFRVNLHRQKGEIAAAVRALPAKVPTLEQLNLPAPLARLIDPNAGLVLVCGPTGAGKSSTLAALIGEINRRFARHIVTIEDPIEYEHLNGRSIIEQIEVGIDAPSFAAALRSSLRQDSNVILVGELRDLDTMSTALTAAETGHLILGTLHTSDATQAVNRVIDVFPANQQAQIRHQLALSLNAIVTQQLIPRADGSGRVPAVELLLMNDAVRNHIRMDRLQNLPSEITLGKRAGMISLEESLAALVRTQVVSLAEARRRSRRPEELDSLLRG